MNLPNRLTVLRILLVPVFIFFMLTEEPLFRILALLVFITASITDCLDGRIARKYSLVTDFGKFMDPLADKVLVMSAFICLTGMKILSPVFTILILIREYLISDFRYEASERNIVIAASKWGKLKTVFHMISAVLMILRIGRCGSIWDIVFFKGDIFSGTVFFLALLLTIVSLIDYILKNPSVKAGKWAFISILRMAPAILFVIISEDGILYTLCCAVIVSSEFINSGFRLIASDNKKSFSTLFPGRLLIFFQLLSAVCMLAAGIFRVHGEILPYTAVLFLIITVINTMYLMIHNRRIILEGGL